MADDPLLAALTETADELYAGPQSGFTPARDAAAKAAGDKALTARIKALKKPSMAAWAVNLLVRREAEQIEQVLGLAASLREAAESMDGDELRALTRQRRQLTTALATAARRLAREEDVKLTPAVVDQVEGVLNAAMLDPVAADIVRSGLLVTAFTSTGVVDLDVAALVAVPEALGVRATPRKSAEREPPALHVVPEDDRVRRERARDALDAATARLTDAESTRDEIAGTLAELSARRLQLAGDIDEVRRRLAELEEELDEVDDDAEDAETARDEADAEVAEAKAERDAAQKALDAFG